MGQVMGTVETGTVGTGRVETVLDRARAAGRPSLVSYV
ncbi:MAG: hypothetical protein QOG05_7044, partial [Streptosporangiaceae bacterium]|nr:hypothetical protein [Streptosporangiaceae bacterium]